jgi:hypothetical protein
VHFGITGKNVIEPALHGGNVVLAQIVGVLYLVDQLVCLLEHALFMHI